MQTAARTGSKPLSVCVTTLRCSIFVATNAIAAVTYHAMRFLRRWCMPRFATSFVRVRRARFCARPAAGRFDRSGGPLARRSVNSPSRSSSSSLHVGLITRFPWVIPCAGFAASTWQTTIAAGRDLVQTRSFSLSTPLQSSFDTMLRGLRGSVCRGVTKFPQNVSCFTAQKRDVAVTIHSRQIHPHSQLP